jgi:diguanylate cyclase (GGDEF)-like protein
MTSPNPHHEEAASMTDMTESTGHPALTDLQTGLPNKLHWDTVFGVIFAAGSRGIPLTLVLLEIDGYGRWVLERGRDEVDKVLMALGKSLGATTRQSDLAARIQEERFAFLLLDCNLAGGRLVADRVDALLDPIRQASGLSFSMGVAAYGRDMARSEDFLGAAESVLIEAQARGENQMEFFG